MQETHVATFTHDMDDESGQVAYTVPTGETFTPTRAIVHAENVALGIGQSTELRLVNANVNQNETDYELAVFDVGSMEANSSFRQKLIEQGRKMTAGQQIHSLVDQAYGDTANALIEIFGITETV